MFDHFTNQDDSETFETIAYHLEGAAMLIEENLETLGAETDDVKANALMDRVRKLGFAMYFLSGELRHLLMKLETYTSLQGK